MLFTTDFFNKQLNSNILAQILVQFLIQKKLSSFSFRIMNLIFTHEIKKLTVSNLKVSTICKYVYFFLLKSTSRISNSCENRKGSIYTPQMTGKNLILLDNLSLISIPIFIWIWYALKPIRCMSVLRPGVVHFKLIIDSRPGSSIGLFGSSVYLRTRTSTEGLQLGPTMYSTIAIVPLEWANFCYKLYKAVFLNSLSYSTTIASFYKGKLTLEVPCYCRILYVMALQC